jgi:2-polyprenyl-6-methoxyphenol hydroxylase-like FAD-dependent oxidoreductase
MVWCAGGREVTSIDLRPEGLPHVTVARAELLGALAAALPADAVTYGARCTELTAVAGDHDLVVVADGANSALRSAITGPVGKQWTWTVWQARVTALRLPGDHDHQLRLRNDDDHARFTAKCPTGC